MKLYFAALHSGWKEIWDKEIPEKILLSYWYRSDLRKTLDYCKKNNLCNKIELILDSGAFTAWSKGVYIDINKYLDCILDIQKNYNFKSFYAVNIDVIPGKKGEKITKQQSEDSMIKGWNNYKYLKFQGVNTIHVYHQGEDENFLLNTIIKECDYIGVSPSNDVSLNQKIIWCERIFHLLPENIKSHGFAVTSEYLMETFPWYSVDSASWSIGAGMGRINTSYGTLYYSSRGEGKNWYSDNPKAKELSEELILKELLDYGVKFDNPKYWQLEIENKHQLRRYINYRYFKKIGQGLENRDFKKYTCPQPEFCFFKEER